ncbi:PhzF family phenazine biosynthesis protein [Kytococcus sedentarius]|uniref:PhzF family phenazine biosynthesis protein n=1 Tax=Kytococcus sedentarius TaxID=1276 RepID=UPI0035BBAFD9
MHPFTEVDVFCTGPFTGNGLAVVHGADDLDDAQLSAIARWTQFSETAFLLQPTAPGADYRVRILTPVTEYPFAGHPTLGAAHAWLAAGGVPQCEGVVVQECGAGLVPVRVAGGDLAFAAPPRTRTGPLDEAELGAVLEALGLGAQDVVAHAWGSNGPQWRLLELRDADAVRSVGASLVGTGLRVGLVGLERPVGGSVAVPAYEVRALTSQHEDPVTGSLHASMAQWMRERGRVPDRYTAVQGSQVGRAGRVTVHDDGDQVWVGGRCVTRVSGRIEAG